MKTKTLALLGITLTGISYAGEEIYPETQELGTLAPVSTGTHDCNDWCDAYRNIGKLYKDKQNPFIQEVKIFGRAHYQYGYTDGDFNGTDFDGDGGELRRLRLGTSIKFLNGFKALGRVNLERGGFRDDSLGYDSFDELYLNYNFGDVAGLKDLTIGYGRYKVLFGGEEHQSSKKIKTIERSNLNNFFAPNSPRPTGFQIDATAGAVDLSLGIYSTEGDRETLAGFNGGLAYKTSALFDAAGGKVTLDFLFTDASGGRDEVFGYDWAGSATYETKSGPWELLANVTYGDTGDENIYGIVIIPSVYLIKDTLEAVFRYQWAHSTSGDGFTINSRNVRNVISNQGLGSTPGGDDNHTFYAGLNWYLCDHNLKLMSGVEYETLDGDSVDLNATTLWLAARTFF